LGCDTERGTKIHLILSLDLRFSTITEEFPGIFLRIIL